MSPTWIERLWEKIDVRGPDDCWPWTASTTDEGYGKLRVAGKLELAHRLVETLTRGPIAPGVLVRHTCDNPPCCNPRHLLRGTAAQNSQEANQRGRLRIPHIFGGAHGNAKLTAELVTVMRVEASDGIGARKIARMHDISREHARAIIRSLAWRHLPGV